MKNLLLLPLSWLYGIVTGIRNHLFDMDMLKSQSYDIPIISVGNITVGGTGKTPHVEYVVRLLQDSLKVAVLSRGYKRKTRGYQVATVNSTAADVGDEPLQIKRKFPDITVAVDGNRREGIERITSDRETKDTDVIVLDDAFQHRYVKPGINILLVDYHRQLHADHLLPYGRLRERSEEKKRADIVIVTKCPSTMKPMDFRLITNSIDTYPYQTLLFSTLIYKKLRPMYCGEDIALDDLSSETSVLLLTGIANPSQMTSDLQPHFSHPIKVMSYGDHHFYSDKDIADINKAFESMPCPRVVITTEKDAARLFGKKEFTDELRHHFYIAPIEVKFLLDDEETFNKKIISYVQKNSRNSILVKSKDDNVSEDGNHTGNGSRTINFRNF